MRKMKTKIVFCLLLLASVSCDDNVRSSIPVRQVNLVRSMLTDTDAFGLMNPGTCKEFVTPLKATDRLGFGGLLVVCGFNFDEKQNHFAFDLACPYEVHPEVRVTMNDALQAECSTCGSKFNVVYGTGVCAEGPAREGLRRYRISVSGYTITVRR